MYDHSIPIFYITLRKEYLHFQQQNKINHKLTLELSQAAVGPTSIFPSFLPYFSWPSHYPFKQSSHLHSSPHAWPALKHSQYFFLHCVFLQVHPFAPLVLLIAAVLIWTTYLALAIAWVWPSQFEHPEHAHSAVHIFPDEKHSQYILRHFVFLHVQPPLFFFISVAELMVSWLAF